MQHDQDLIDKLTSEHTAWPRKEAYEKAASGGRKLQPQCKSCLQWMPCETTQLLDVIKWLQSQDES